MSIERSSQVFAAPVPIGLVIHERDVIGDISELSDVEFELVRTAILRRKQEFAAGRACARAALRQLGIIDFHLLIGDGRAPIWPKEIVGSITHTHGYCAAVVGRSHLFESVGIDAEFIGAVDAEIWNLLFTNVERTQLLSANVRDRNLLSTVFFSAKEAFFKFQYQITKQWVEFTDVFVSVNKQFVEIRSNSSGTHCMARGHYHVCSKRNVVITLITALKSPYHPAADAEWDKATLNDLLGRKW